MTVPRSVHNGVPAESLLVSGAFTALPLVLVLPLRSSPCVRGTEARHEQHSEHNAHVHEGSVRGRGVRACSARHPEQQTELHHATLKELVDCALLLERVLHLKEVGTFCGR